jgi:hypothetical protein
MSVLFHYKYTQFLPQKNIFLNFRQLIPKMLVILQKEEIF